MTTLENTKKFIVDEVNKNWESSEKAMLLSDLGVKIKRNITDAEKIITTSLTDFIRQNPVVKTVTYPGIPAKIGAIPLNCSIPVDVTDIFNKKGKNITPSYSYRFPTELWESFHKPIEQKRFVLFYSDGTISITNGDQPPEGESVEIRDDDIAKPEKSTPTHEKAKQTSQAIARWASKNNINIEKIIENKNKKNHQPSTALSHLTLAFKDLEKQDLSRISIPLDIILKLASKQ
tara:strand:- start:1188 stop:1886 length:699 start_codon:yes stop_codon:yes gene_type:complete